MKIDVEFIALDPSKVLVGLSYQKSMMFETIHDENDVPLDDQQAAVYRAHIYSIGFFFFYFNLLFFIPVE